MLLCRGPPGIIWTRSINSNLWVPLARPWRGAFCGCHRGDQSVGGLPARGSPQGRDLRATSKPDLRPTLGAVTFVVALHREYVGCGNR